MLKMRNNLSRFVYNKPKNLNIFVALVLTFSSFFGTMTAFAETLFDVRVDLDGKWTPYKTKSMKVSEFLAKNNIVLGEYDIINFDLNTVIDKDLFIIHIDTAENFNFIFEDKKIPFTLNNVNVGTAINTFNKKFNKNVYLEEGQGFGSGSDVKNGMNIKVASFKEKIDTIEEKIPFEVQTIENPDLLEGETLVREGSEGIKVTTVKEIYRGDLLESKEILSEEVLTLPIAKVIEKGTKKPNSNKTTNQVVKNSTISDNINNSTNTIQTDKGIFTFNKKFKMKSTAYTADYESTGKSPGDFGYGITASGMKARRGVVAVDTSVIPFGTRLFIEGYGYAIAGDTGSAIKGNKVDLFFDDYNDAINYGVKNVNVYVLDKKIS